MDYSLTNISNEESTKPHRQSNAFTVILIILAILLAAAAVVFLILWLVQRNKNNTNPAALSITGLNVNLQNGTTLVATWKSVGNSGDLVTLYADTIPINLNVSGVPESNPNVLKSNTVPGSVGQVSIAKLTLNTKYYYEVVVTNPSIPGFNPEPGLIYTGSIPTGNFIIQQYTTPGGITLNTADNSTVTYQTNVNKTGLNDVWNYDTNTQAIYTYGVGKYSQTSPALYNNNGTLAAMDLKTLQGQSNFNNVAKWTYNSNGTWCLTNSPTACMNLNLPLSSTSSNINVNSQSPTTQWMNISTIQSF